jgi:hypothetical protein
VFTHEPLSVTVTGGTVVLDAVASGAVSYQWKLDGSPIAGATEPVLVLTGTAAAAGTYTCVASNGLGSTTSTAATVTVAAATDTGRLINLSNRGVVGTGTNILITGFVVGGSTARTVLIRASGPALAPFLVSGFLADPQLMLYAGPTLLGANQGWGGASAIAQAAASVGAFAWPSPSSADSALLLTLPPGAYTAEVSGFTGDTGIALVEVFEVP